MYKGETMKYGLIVKDPRSTEYLYGVKGSYFLHHSYKSALEHKIMLGKKLTKELLSEQLDMPITVEKYSLLEDRINKVVNAIHHNKFLLEELLCK